MRSVLSQVYGNATAVDDELVQILLLPGQDDGAEEGAWLFIKEGAENGAGDRRPVASPHNALIIPFPLILQSSSRCSGRPRARPRSRSSPPLRCALGCDSVRHCFNRSILPMDRFKTNN